MNTADIQALLDKQTEGARERDADMANTCMKDNLGVSIFRSEYDRHKLLKTIDQYKRLMPWVGHSPHCVTKRLFLRDKEVCVCKLKAEHESIRKEIEG